MNRTVTHTEVTRYGFLLESLIVSAENTRCVREDSVSQRVACFEAVCLLISIRIALTLPFSTASTLALLLQETPQVE